MEGGSTSPPSLAKGALQPSQPDSGGTQIAPLDQSPSTHTQGRQPRLIKMMMMQRGPGEQTKHRMHLAKALCDEVRGGGLNRGQKSSAPLDVMLEELQLPTNRGSRMFQERQKRVQHFTLENAANGSNTGNFGRVLPPLPAPGPQPGKENLLTPRVGKHSLVLNLQKTIAKKGNPEVLAPGYSGPLRGVPCERFNSTVIPRSYSSPWREGGGDDQRILATLTEQLPKPPEPPTFRCFNRSALPFGGPMASRRVIPVMSCEALEAQSLPANSRSYMSRRPDFNRAPKGWGMDYCPESSEL